MRTNINTTVLYYCMYNAGVKQHFFNAGVETCIFFFFGAASIHTVCYPAYSPKHLL